MAIVTAHVFMHHFVHRYICTRMKVCEHVGIYNSALKCRVIGMDFFTTDLLNSVLKTFVL